MGEETDVQIINVTSGLNRKDNFAPLVVLQWGAQQAVLTPEEARQHALLILAAADAAETDAFLHSFMVNDLKQKEEDAHRLIAHFKQFRAQLDARQSGND